MLSRTQINWTHNNFDTRSKLISIKMNLIKPKRKKKNNNCQVTRWQKKCTTAISRCVRARTRNMKIIISNKTRMKRKITFESFDVTNYQNKWKQTNGQMNTRGQTEQKKSLFTIKKRVAHPHHIYRNWWYYVMWHTNKSTKQRWKNKKTCIEYTHYIWNDIIRWWLVLYVLYEIAGRSKKLNFIFRNETKQKIIMKSRKPKRKQKIIYS